MFLTGVPDSAPGSTEKHLFVKCGVRGDTSPGCNAVGMIDRKILGIQHLYGRPVYARSKQCSIDSPQNGPLPSDAPSWCQAPFDPEGLLRTSITIESLTERSCSSPGLHMNKPLYTLSYTLGTAGAGGLLFSGIYTLVDIYGYRRADRRHGMDGMHALMIYVLIACNVLPIFIHGFYWKEPKNNLLKFIGIGA
ncbi:hypothetical protein ZEAMMB73_Zm00001d020125 [Zea mays]|uniref:Uncharacterized protein n=1 Tax=Zea mays TaxID=4577 RepID=A0A1D6I284_MAIZE|nr:hypothetical protein ZEAMMB73_Zm00001d020125 [Zea mays]